MGADVKTKVAALNKIGAAYGATLKLTRGRVSVQGGADQFRRKVSQALMVAMGCRQSLADLKAWYQSVVPDPVYQKMLDEVIPRIEAALAGLEHRGEVEINGCPIRFNRRRYGGRSGGTTYTWPFIFFDGEWYALRTDPYPAVNWPRAELAVEVQRVIADPRANLWDYPAQAVAN